MRRAARLIPSVILIAASVFLPGCPPNGTVTVYIANASLYDITEFYVLNQQTLVYDNVLTGPVYASTMTVLNLPAAKYQGDSSEAQIVIPGHLNSTFVRLQFGPDPVAFSVYESGGASVGADYLLVSSPAKAFESSGETANAQ